MMHRHKTEYATIESERIDAERKEDREYQRQVMGKLAGVEVPKATVKAEKAVLTESVATAEPGVYVAGKPYVGKRKKKK
jgi:hypothetical protein